ncbi:MAG TPA: FCD domain-containing protein [Syntrophorhabdaceae bacterium]|nr:FCD domain-containing protein [Syntrophorhabdaceae bacterium]
MTDYEALIGPIRNRRTFEEVSDKLKELIFNGTLKPGQQLPSENTLAQLFKVGRQSVREALRILELSGFITTRAGVRGGAVIERTMLTKMTGPFLDTFKFHKVSLEDCMSARRAIEISVLDFAIRNADKSDIINLRENIARAKAKLRTNNAAYEENIDFHRILARASKNYTFCIVMESIMAVFADFKSRAVGVRAEQSRKIIKGHEELVNAIDAKKKKLAIELLGKDLSNAKRILLGNSE